MQNVRKKNEKVVVLSVLSKKVFSVHLKDKNVECLIASDLGR